MPLLSTLDLLALAWFLGAWAAYTVALAWNERRKRGLNSEMNRYRDLWMRQMLARDMRMVDAQIVAALQNGTAFFASTSRIAVGGALTLLRSTEELLQVVGALPFGIKSTAVQWEAKTIGLAIIFVYAFFKFGWSYRLYTTMSRSWWVRRRPRRRRIVRKRRPTPSGSAGCVRWQAATSTAANAHSSSRSAISVGSSARGC